MRHSIIVACALGFSTVAHAQVLPFNEAGVTMGHHHLMVADVEAQRKIWIDALGGEPSGNPPLLFVKFPGAFLILSSGKGTEGTHGSALDHFAFNVKDLRGTRAKLADLEAPYALVAVPLLVETNFAELVDRILVVDAPEPAQLERLMRRDAIPKPEALAMIRAQVDRATRLKAAHDVIDNGGTTEATRRQVELAHRRYLDLAAQRARAN